MGIAGWMVAALAVLMTGISKVGLGGALGGLAVPMMSIWLPPRDVVAIVLPLLIATDLVGIRAWKGQAEWSDLQLLVPAAILGIVAGTLAVLFAVDRMIRRTVRLQADGATHGKWLGILCGATSGFTSTLAHAGGPPVILYLLSRELPRRTFVATSVYFFTLINLAKLPFYLGLGIFTRETLMISAIFLPLVPIGGWCGLRVLARSRERPFFLLATVALGLSGLKLLWDGLFG